MTATAVGARPDRAVSAPWRSILCGVSGGAAGREAVRQAARLAAGAPLGLVAVTPAGVRRLFQPLPEAAEAALAEARAIADESGCPAYGGVVTAPSEIDGLLRSLAPDRLLVVGSGDIAGAHGPALGPVVSAALVRAPGPVMVARRSSGDTGNILVAFDGAAGDMRAARAAAHIAAHHRSEVAILASARPDAVAVAASSLEAWLVVVAAGDGAEPIARTSSCSVLVVR